MIKTTNPKSPPHKNKKPRINRINIENSDNVLKAFIFLLFLLLMNEVKKWKNLKYSISLDKYSIFVNRVLF